MGLDIYFYKRPIIDKNKNAREALLDEMTKIETEIGTRGRTYYDVFRNIRMVEYERSKKVQNQDAIKIFSDKVETLDPNGYFREKINEDKPLIERYQKLIEEVEALDDSVDVGYFRKVNFLLPFFGYTDNGTDKRISKEEVEELIKRCHIVLDNKDEAVSVTILRTESGYFYGSTDYDDFYYNNVENVLSTFETILKEMDWENEMLVMDCSW